MVALSIVIPARNEQFLAQTIQNILENIRGETEIIAVLDGKWAEPQVPDDPRVTLVYHPQSVGQRAAINDPGISIRAAAILRLTFSAQANGIV